MRNIDGREHGNLVLVLRREQGDRGSSNHTDIRSRKQHLEFNLQAAIADKSCHGPPVSCGMAAKATCPKNIHLMNYDQAMLRGAAHSPCDG